jgi:2',3'-cyclic-nucleotide 2'-phosphodiesterase (5'-nucleotidase family)
MGDISKVKTGFLVKGLSHLGYDAINVGTADLNAGGEFVKHLNDQYSADFISANLVYANTNEPVFRPYKILDLDPVNMAKNIPFTSLRVGIFGLLEPRDMLFSGTLNEPPMKSLDPFPIALQTVAELKGQVDVIILLYYGRGNFLEDILKNVPEIDAVAMGGEYFAANRLEREVTTPVGASSTMGKYFNGITLKLNAQKEVIGSDQIRIALTEQIADDPWYLNLVQEYEAKSREMVGTPQSRAQQ